MVLVTAEGDWPSRAAAAVKPPCATTRVKTRNAMNLSIRALPPFPKVRCLSRGARPDKQRDVDFAPRQMRLVDRKVGRTGHRAAVENSHEGLCLRFAGLWREPRAREDRRR